MLPPDIEKEEVKDTAASKAAAIGKLKALLTDKLDDVIDVTPALSSGDEDTSGDDSDDGDDVPTIEAVATVVTTD